MKKFLSFLVLTLSLSIVAQAQKADGSIKGKLIDTASKQPIPDATISVQNVKDSSLVTFTLSNKQGGFEVKGLAEGDYSLVITSKGFATTKKSVSITATQKTVDLADL